MARPGPRRRRRTRRSRGMDLPDEVLGQVLRRVPPRQLAACRRVCKDWRAAIDGHGLVLAHLAPRPPRGIFVKFFGALNPGFFFFSRRGAPPARIGSALRFLPDWWTSYTSRVLDHSNGLVLYEDDTTMYVCNPVTRRWAVVPPPPSVHINRSRVYLVSDPTVSLQYHVLYFPDAPDDDNETTNTASPPPGSSTGSHEHEVAGGLTEWPLHSYKVHVYSSATGQWEERNLIRQGDAVLTLSDVLSDQYARNAGGGLRCYAVYSKGVFYLHCYGEFLVRFSLLQDKYTAIKTPRLTAFLTEPRQHTNAYGNKIKHRGRLGKSEQGVYYTAVYGYRLAVWILREEEASTGTPPEWELKHQADLELSLRRHHNRFSAWVEGKSWILHPPEHQEEEEESNVGWDSSDDDDDDTSVIDDVGAGEISGNDEGLDVLGYHPCKEIVFLGSLYIGFAYYLGSSKLELLGSLHPMAYCYHLPYEPKLGSFVYTPCMDDLLPAHGHDL